MIADGYPGSPHFTTEDQPAAVRYGWYPLASEVPVGQRRLHPARDQSLVVGVPDCHLYEPGRSGHPGRRGLRGLSRTSATSPPDLRARGPGGTIIVERVRLMVATGPPVQGRARSSGYGWTTRASGRCARPHGWRPSWWPAERSWVSPAQSRVGRGAAGPQAEGRGRLHVPHPHGRQPAAAVHRGVHRPRAGSRAQAQQHSQADGDDQVRREDARRPRADAGRKVAAAKAAETRKRKHAAASKAELTRTTRRIGGILMTEPIQVWVAPSARDLTRDYMMEQLALRTRGITAPWSSTVPAVRPAQFFTIEELNSATEYGVFADAQTDPDPRLQHRSEWLSQNHAAVKGLWKVMPAAKLLAQSRGDDGCRTSSTPAGRSTTRTRCSRPALRPDHRVGHRHDGTAVTKTSASTLGRGFHTGRSRAHDSTNLRGEREQRYPALARRICRSSAVCIGGR